MGDDFVVAHAGTPPPAVRRFYRRAGAATPRSSGDDTIHAVTNPRQAFTAAIHIYGGDITRRPGRSEWDESTAEELGYDFERVKHYFEAANAQLS